MFSYVREGVHGFFLVSSWTEIQPFKNVKIYKEMYGHLDARPYGLTFLCKF